MDCARVVLSQPQPEQQFHRLAVEPWTVLEQPSPAPERVESQCVVDELNCLRPEPDGDEECPPYHRRQESFQRKACPQPLEQPLPPRRKRKLHEVEDPLE